MKPIQSVKVVSQTVEASAGSILRAFRPRGISDPARPAHRMFNIIATNQVGDGKIFISEVVEAIRIRSVLKAARGSGHGNVALGALGCGAREELVCEGSPPPERSRRAGP